MIHIRDYVARRKAELDAFEADWYECMRKDPESYDFETATYGAWVEQEEAYTEMRAEEKESD